MGYECAVYKDSDGDRLVVASGGSVQVLTGGKIVPNSGTQAAHVVNAAVAAGAAPDKAEFDALVGKFNAVLVALEGAGILASS